MSTIQEQMKMYHVIENVLRNAAQTQNPMALRDIWETAEVREAIPKEHSVRDKINVLVNHGLVTKVTIAMSSTGDKRSRVGYMWAALDTSADDRIDYKHAASGAARVKHPVFIPKSSKAQDKPSDNVEIEINGMTVYARQGVQMFIQDVICVVDKNPVSGLVRIVIK